MKNYKNKKRQMNTETIFNIDRLDLNDTLESGQSLTLGIDYKRK